MRTLLRVLSLLLVCSLGSAVLPAAEVSDTITVASTTSTEDSGLFEYLLPKVRERTGVRVKVVALGTGQALDTARRGDADVVFVHDPEAEKQFVAAGEGLERHPVMYNDFVVVGPRSDPAHIRGSKDVVEALRRVRDTQAPFISRGDRSGTHQAELRLWTAAGVDVGVRSGSWYRSVGQGMGAALNMASASNAYLLADRATWVRFGNKGELQVLVEGDRRLFNQYGLILVNPARHPDVNRAAGQRFIDYLLSPEGQRTIAAYRVEGQQLFHPNAGAAASK